MFGEVASGAFVTLRGWVEGFFELLPNLVLAVLIVGLAPGLRDIGRLMLGV